MNDTKDLVQKLRSRNVLTGDHGNPLDEAADVLEAQDKRIAELEDLAQGRLEQMESDRKQALVWRDALHKIAALDPAVDSDEGYNEWGEADCFRKAQAIAAPGANRVQG